MDEYEAILRAARNLGDLIVAMYGENGPSCLTQVFMRGPFAGMSIREVLLLGYRLRDEQPPPVLGRPEPEDEGFEGLPKGIDA